MEHKTVLIIASLLVSIFTVSKWYQVHSVPSGRPCGSVISISEWIPAPSLNIMLMRLFDHLWFCFSLFGFFCTGLCFAYARSLVLTLLPICICSVVVLGLWRVCSTHCSFSASTFCLTTSVILRLWAGKMIKEKSEWSRMLGCIDLCQILLYNVFFLYSARLPYE